MIVKCALKLVNHPEVVLLLNGCLDSIRLLLNLLLSPVQILHVKVILQLLVIITILSSSIDLVLHLSMCLVSLHTLEESVDDSREEVSRLVKLSQDTEQVLVCQ